MFSVGKARFKVPLVHWGKKWFILRRLCLCWAARQWWLQIVGSTSIVLLSSGRVGCTVEVITSHTTFPPFLDPPLPPLYTPWNKCYSAIFLTKH